MKTDLMFGWAIVGVQGRHEAMFILMRAVHSAKSIGHSRCMKLEFMICPHQSITS